jgi:PAS domain S-box-containing protein
MYSDGMFRELVESSDDIIIVTGHDFKIQYISSSVTKCFGLEPVRFIGKNIFSFVDPEKISRWKECLELSSFSSFHDEIIFRTGKGSEMWFDVHVANHFNRASIRGLVLKLHDISAKKSREQELIRSNQQLDQVIFKTTHDLKAPLMSAMGLVSLAEKASVDEQSNYISLIKKSLLRLDSFIDEMNHFFRNEKLAVKRDKIDVKALLHEELNNVSNLYDESILDIQFRVEATSEFYSDNIRLKSIVANILSNAIKYYDPLKRAPFVRVTVLVNEEFCEICFEDNGIGIDPQYHAKIFDLFFRATDQSQGTGMGLFIVKDTIEKLKGDIEVHSKESQGSVFRIRIPNQLYQPIEVD